MSAVAAPSRPKAATKKATPPKAVANAEVSEYTPASIEAAFGSVELLLNHAHATDEAHDWSGDSDRLLRIAHQLADEANIRPPAGADVARVAFDIAALIRAARLVPGDSEGPERKALLDQAAVQLDWLTESSGCCDPGVPRPAAPNAVRLDQTPGISDETECIELARQATYEIQKLAEAMQLVADQLSTEEDHPITHGLMARIIVLAEITFHAAALHGEGRAESTPLKELQRVFKGPSEHDLRIRKTRQPLPWNKSPQPGSLAAAALLQPMSPAVLRMSTPPTIVNPGVWYEEHAQLCYDLQVAAVRAARDSSAEAAVGKAHAALLAHAAIINGGSEPVLLAKDGIHTIPFERLAAARAKIKVLEAENFRLRQAGGAGGAGP